jgi:recombination protein RecR
MANTIEKLIEIFKEFPGIGERQAKRFVYFLISKNDFYNNNLISSISELKKEISQCPECFRFFLGQNEKKCDLCLNPNNDSSSLMIVEKDSDLESMHKSKIYNGKYFILGGLVPVVEKNTRKKIRINELIDKIKKEKNLKEIILAFSLSPQGNHTDFYLRSELKNICGNQNIKISSLGRGLSTGTELEYSDNETLKNALKNRN